jgi:hypothetical protein
MQEDDQVGLGDPRELPQKLRTVLGNRFISDPLPSLNWGALLLRAFGFRAPSAEEARLLEGFVETNSADQAEMSGDMVAAALGVDITLVKSTGTKEEFRSNLLTARAAAEKVEIFALQKSKTFVAVVQTEARKEPVKDFIKTLWKEKLRKQITPEREDAEQRETEVTNKKRKEQEQDPIFILDEKSTVKRMSLQKIPILAELTDDAFKNFSTEVQQYQTEWDWTDSIAYSIKKKVGKLWEMGRGKKWIEADNINKVEFLSEMQAIIKRATGHYKTERIMIDDPVLKWRDGVVDWEEIVEQVEERELEGQEVCRVVQNLFKDTKYYTEVQREMSTIRKSDLALADPLLISISMAKRAVQVVDQEGRDAAGAGRIYGLKQGYKSWYDTHPENFQRKKIFFERGNGAGMETNMKGNGDLGCYKCGGFGHIRKDCPMKDKDTSARRKLMEEVVCYSCGLKGHYANACPSKMPEEEVTKEEEDKKVGKVMQTRVTFKKGTNAVTAVQAAEK